MQASSGKLGVGVLLSGRGSNFEALGQACRQPDFPAEIRIVISNNPDAGGLQRAAALGLTAQVIDHHDYPSKAEFETALGECLDEHGVELVCLAGFMRVLSTDFVRARANRILNIHPSLLPSFPGLHVHRQALEYGVRFSGCTVHLVTAEVDAGPIVLQAVVAVEPDDSEETLAARILDEEHRIYPQAVRLYAEGRLRIEGRRVVILPEARGGGGGTGTYAPAGG